MGNHNSGRRPKPTALKLLQGNPGKRKPNPHEPKPPQGPVKKPVLLSAGAALVWDDLAPVCVTMGTLTVADVAAFSTLCELQASFRAIVVAKDHNGQLFTVKADADTPTEVCIVIDSLLKAERDTAAALRPFYERFGLDPVGRARITVAPKDAPASKWAGLA